MTLEELKEKLADIEHQRWSHWQEYCNKVLREQVPKLGLEKVLERWDRQINTPYAELSEKEKQSDRNQVERYWGLIEEYLDQTGREDVRKDTHDPLVEELKEEVRNKNLVAHVDVSGVDVEVVEFDDLDTILTKAVEEARKSERETPLTKEQSQHLRSTLCNEVVQDEKEKLRVHIEREVIDPLIDPSKSFGVEEAVDTLRKALTPPSQEDNNNQE